jgi:hypothetical protein
VQVPGLTFLQRGIFPRSPDQAFHQLDVLLHLIHRQLEQQPHLLATSLVTTLQIQQQRQCKNLLQPLHRWHPQVEQEMFSETAARDLDMSCVTAQASVFWWSKMMVSTNLLVNLMKIYLNCLRLTMQEVRAARKNILMQLKPTAMRI